MLLGEVEVLNGRSRTFRGDELSEGSRALSSGLVELLRIAALDKRLVCRSTVEYGDLRRN